MRGTWLNTATVAVGATLGAVGGHHIPATYRDVALHGIGLVVIGFAIKMVLAGRNPLVTIAAVSLGGIVGVALGLDTGIENVATWAQSQTHSDGPFATGIVTTFVLFCAGPMTVLGCLQDGLEGKIEILSLKSAMDGISAFFFAAALGYGVLVTAILLFVFQGGLTLLARPLRRLASDEELLGEVTAVGGAILIGTGLGILGLVNLGLTNYLPALLLAPLFCIASRKLAVRFSG